MPGAACWAIYLCVTERWIPPCKQPSWDGIGCRNNPLSKLSLQSLLLAVLLPVFAVSVRGGPCAGGVFTSPTSSRQERGIEMSAVRRVVKKANDCRRFKAKITYNGELFSGWQKQGAQNGRSFRTVEETLETCIGSALAQVLSAVCFERRLLFCL